MDRITIRDLIDAKEVRVVVPNKRSIVLVLKEAARLLELEVIRYESRNS